jgi:hypothetical protein
MDSLTMRASLETFLNSTILDEKMIFPSGIVLFSKVSR